MQSVVSVVKDETMTGDSGHMPLMIYNMFGYDGQVKPVQSSLKKGEVTLPEDICGLYLPGGYPELYARPLSENKTKMCIRDSRGAGHRLPQGDMCRAVGSRLC